MTLLARGGASAGDLRAGPGQRRFHLGCSVKQTPGEWGGSAGGGMNHRARAAPGAARRSFICAVFGNCWSFPSLLAFICSLGLKAGLGGGGAGGVRER